MTRSAAFQNENNFSRGLITEATGLNFPEDAAIDCDNCRFEEDGTVSRRRALDQEPDLTLKVPSSSLGVVREYIWKAVGNSGTRSFLVVQFGAGISFFQEDANGNYGGGEKSFGISLPFYQIKSPSDLEQHPCSFTSGNGRLFIAQRYINPLAVEYDEVTDTITVTPITVEVRDLEGVDDGLEVRERPTTLSTVHEYNIQNQSFNRDELVQRFSGGFVDKIDDWFASRGDYPSNADIWWINKNEEGLYSPAALPDRIHYGNSPAPKGHWIFDAFDIDRNAKIGLTGIPGEQTDIRPSQVAFYAGRVWYSGVEDTDFTQKVYFSQIVEGPTQFGKCYQINDPTSEQISDLLDSDGGRLSILDMGTVVNMQVVLDQLIIFSSEGIWSVSGGDGTGFKATDFSIRKISSVECPSPYSFLDVDGLPIWWSFEGIYTLRPNEAGNQLVVSSLTDTTIKTFYQSILKDSRLFAKGAYDPVSKEIQWIYRSLAPIEFVDNFKYDRLLVLNTVTGSFSPWSTDISLFGIAGIFVSDGTNNFTKDIPVVDFAEDQVQNAALDNIIVTVPDLTRQDGRFKYLTCAAGGIGSLLKFGEEVDPGAYNLTTTGARGHPVFDFEEREFYQFIPNTAPTPDELRTYSMVDNLQTSTINLNWDANVNRVIDGPTVLHTDGLMYVNIVPEAGGIYDNLPFNNIAVLDPTTGNTVSLNAPDVSTQDPYEWLIFNVNGVTHMAMEQPVGLNNHRYRFWRYTAGAWATVGDGATFGFNQDNGYICGVKENLPDGSTDFYYLDKQTDDIRFSNITPAGAITNGIKWTTPFTVAAALYLPAEGNIVIKTSDAGTEIEKFTFDDDLFTEIWSNPTALSTGTHTFPVINSSRFETNMGMGDHFSLTVDFISLATGENLCNVAKTSIDNTNGGIWSDDIGGVVWMSNNVDVFWRYQSDCGLESTGFGFGGEAVPTGTVNDYTDWITVNAVGIDYTSYFTTGAKVHADGMRDFQSNYVTVFSKHEFNSSCRMHGRWDWSSSTASGEFSTPQQVYTNRVGRDVQRRRLKVRGNGPALQMHFTSETGKPFNIIGWSIFETAESLP